MRWSTTNYELNEILLHNISYLIFSIYLSHLILSSGLGHEFSFHIIINSSTLTYILEQAFI